MSNDGDSEFDFLELPTGGISVEDLEEDPFGYAPAPKKSAASSAVLTAVLIPVSDSIISGLSEKYLGLRINGISDTKGLATCKEAKKKCVEVRNLIESSRVELKKPHLEMGRKIDAEAKRLQELLEPTESYLTHQIETVEKSLKKIEQERLDRLYLKRKNELDAINLTLPEASVRAMTDEEFANLIERSLAEFEEKMELSRLHAEEQRKLEAERAKQQAEADRLAAERAEMQRKQDEQNAEIARQREELAAQQREFQRQKEAAAKAEQDRLDAIERERIAEQNRIAREKQLEERRIMAERMRPFSEQLESFASRVMLLANEAPQVSPSVDDEVTGAIVDAATEIHNIAERLVAIPGVEQKQEDEFSDV